MLLRFQGLISSNWRCSFISVLHFDDENEIVMVGFLYHDHPLGMICMANAGEHAYATVSQLYLCILNCISQMYLSNVFLYHDH